MHIIGGQTVNKKSTTENWYVVFYIIIPTLYGWAIANPAHPVNYSLHASVGCFRIKIEEHTVRADSDNFG